MPEHANRATYPLSLHDALPICLSPASSDIAVIGTAARPSAPGGTRVRPGKQTALVEWDPATGATGYSLWRSTTSMGASTSVVDRKSTRLHSSHRCISYAVFCLK